MTVGEHTMHFTYDGAGSPLSVTYGSETYYYVTNLQGDVVTILESDGTAVVYYAYDAWGNLISTTGDMADTLGFYNPLRYRGYVYDAETELYYLQSRYYNPEMGRFINADGFASTGQGVLGNNMFAYCGNNPIIRVDPTGYRHAMHADACGGVKRSKIADRITLVFTSGYYVCISLGAFNLSGTLEPYFDLKGNTQLFSTFSFDVTTSGSLSLSVGSTASALFAPDTSYAKGDATYLGGGVACPIPYTPISGTASANVLRTSDGYWGIGTTTGIAVPSQTKMGGDLHAGYSHTIELLPQINVFDSLIIIRSKIKGVSPWEE